MNVHRNFNLLVESQVNHDPFNHCLAVLIYYAQRIFLLQSIIVKQEDKCEVGDNQKGRSQINSDVVNDEQSQINSDNAASVFFI